jgi:hypothetical protein
MRKGLAAAGVVALIAAGSAACGTATASTPDAKIKNAFDKLQNKKSLALGLHFDASADQIYAALQGSDGFTKANATTLAELHATVSASSDKAFKDIKSGDKGSFAFQLTSDAAGKKNLIEVRSVDQKVYLRADLKGLTNLGGSSTSKDLAGIDQFIAQADKLPSSMGSVKAAVHGEWITIDPKSFTSFLKSFGGSGSGSPLGALPDTGKSLDAKTQQQVLDALQKALRNNAKYKDLGNHDGADHVQVTLPARQFAKELQGSLGSLTKQIPDFKPSDLNDVPNKTVAVDVAIKGGSVSGITFDLVQLDTSATGKLPLTIAVDDGAEPVSAPKGAKILNPQDLIGLFMSGLGSDDTSTGSGSSDSSDGSGWSTDTPLPKL